MGRAAKRKAGRRAADTSSLTDTAPEYTVAPGALSEDGVSSWMNGRDRTSAEPSEDDDAYAKTSWGLLDKHFLHKGLRMPPGITIAVSVVVWIGLAAWLFQQDNGAGRLETGPGMIRFYTKIAVAGGLIVGGAVALVAFGSLVTVLRRVVLRADDE